MVIELTPRTCRFGSRVGWTLLSLAVGIGCGGCGAAQAPEARSTVPPASQREPARDAIHSAPTTATNVAISDEIRARCGIPDEDAYFAFDSARVDVKDRTALDRVARCFSTGPLKGHTVKLIGRADPRGQTDYNMVLGLSRADAVSQYLVTRGPDADDGQDNVAGRHGCDRH